MSEPTTFTMATLRDAAGSELGVSDWIVVDQDRITAFAEATEDRQWIHVDRARAAKGPFGATIAHGFLTLSLLPWINGQLFRLDGARMRINYGLNKVRFPAPVPAGSRVRGRTRIVGVDAVPGGLQVVLATTVECEGVDKPVCVAESILRALE